MFKSRSVTNLLDDLIAVHIREEQIGDDKVDERARGIAALPDGSAELLSGLHRERPDLPVIMGGIHATMCPENVIARPEVDAVIICNPNNPDGRLFDRGDLHARAADGSQCFRKSNVLN